MKQKNEGGWDFYWDEESKPGNVVLEVKVAKYLDSSLIDVDVHPTYVSVIIKSKLLRLKIPVEVKSSECTCQRSKTTGSLLVIMPKVNPKENAVTVRVDTKAKSRETVTSSTNSNNSRVKIKSKSAAASIQDQMLQDAMSANQPSLSNEAVGNSMVNQVSNIVKVKESSAYEEPSFEATNSIPSGVSRIVELS